MGGEGGVCGCVGGEGCVGVVFGEGVGGEGVVFGEGCGEGAGFCV